MNNGDRVAACAPAGARRHSDRVNAAAPLRVTTVRTDYREGRRNHRVLFGTPLRTDTLDRTEGYTTQVWSFARGARFALDLWVCNAYGTIQWRCFVCEAIGPGDDGERNLDSFSNGSASWKSRASTH